jgi:hypothetical protein
MKPNIIHANYPESEIIDNTENINITSTSDPHS